MAESECAAYKELKDRETRAHTAWTSHLFRNESNQGYRKSQAESIRKKKWKHTSRLTKLAWLTRRHAQRVSNPR